MTKTILFIISISAIFAYVLYLIYSKQKSYALYGVAVLALLIGSYNVIEQKNTINTHEMSLAFENRKKIICQDVHIDKSNFNLVTGTNVFLGKKNTKYYGHTLALENCEIGKE